MPKQSRFGKSKVDTRGFDWSRVPKRRDGFVNLNAIKSPHLRREIILIELDMVHEQLALIAKSTFSTDEYRGKRTNLDIRLHKLERILKEMDLDPVV